MERRARYVVPPNRKAPFSLPGACRRFSVRDAAVPSVRSGGRGKPHRYRQRDGRRKRAFRTEHQFLRRNLPGIQHNGDHRELRYRADDHVRRRPFLRRVVSDQLFLQRLHPHRISLQSVRHRILRLHLLDGSHLQRQFHGQRTIRSRHLLQRRRGPRQGQGSYGHRRG